MSLLEYQNYSASDVCYTLDHPANGQVEYGSDGFTATYTCNSGYELMFGNSTRECDKHGWSGTQPMCPGIYIIIRLFM